jgi:hypothetical protein
VEPSCSNIVVQRIVNDHTSYMTRVRTKCEMNGEISENWSASTWGTLRLLHSTRTWGITRDGQGYHHLPPTPQSGARHIWRFPCTRAPRPCTRKLHISPRDSDPTDRQARIWANSKEWRTATSTLVLLLLIQIIWMFKHKVEHVKIITRKLYASSYIMIITRQLYSSSYALLYKWYESKTLEELLIIFRPRFLSLLPRSQVLLDSFASSQYYN